MNKNDAVMIVVGFLLTWGAIGWTGLIVLLAVQDVRRKVDRILKQLEEESPDA